MRYLYKTIPIKELKELALLYRKCGFKTQAFKIYQRISRSGHHSVNPMMKDLALEDAEAAEEFVNDLERRGQFEQACLFCIEALGKSNNYARSWINQARTQAEGGDARALFYLGRYLFEDTESYIAIIHSAEQENPQALSYLQDSQLTAQQCFAFAKLYYAGEYVKPNTKAALDFFERAAALKHANSCLFLSEHFFAQSSSPAQVQTGFSYLSRGAQYGSETCHATMQQLVKEHNPIATFYWVRDYLIPLQKLADAAYFLIKCSNQYPQAKAYLESEQFTAEMFFALAKVFIEHTEIPQNFSMSETFCLKAIRQQHPQAAYYLGSLYSTLSTEEPEYLEKSFHHFMQAVLWGHSNALSALESIGAEVSAEQQIDLAKLHQYHFNDEGRARYWYEQACVQGSEEAKTYLYRLGNSL